MREWRANNHEKQASYFQAWRDANRERKAAADKAWRDKNRERVRESHRSSELQRRAKKRGRFVEYVDPQIVLDQNQGLCGICWDPIVDQDFHVDHIIPLCLDGEHSYENAQPAHPRCNLSKGGRLAS
jgi:5-methylcytosine-specific restriction endonuclease McrA